MRGITKGIVAKFRYITDIITSNPLRCLVFPPFVYAWPSRLAIEGPAMTFNKCYGVCIVIVFDFCKKNITIQNDHCTSRSYKLLKVVILSLSNVFLMA